MIISSDVSAKSQRLRPSSPRANRMPGRSSQLRPYGPSTGPNANCGVEHVRLERQEKDQAERQGRQRRPQRDRPSRLHVQTGATANRTRLPISGSKTVITSRVAIRDVLILSTVHSPERRSPATGDRVSSSSRIQSRAATPRAVTAA